MESKRIPIRKIPNGVEVKSMKMKENGSIVLRLSDNVQFQIPKDRKQQMKSYPGYGLGYNINGYEIEEKESKICYKSIVTGVSLNKENEPTLCYLNLPLECAIMKYIFGVYGVLKEMILEKDFKGELRVYNIILELNEKDVTQIVKEREYKNQGHLVCVEGMPKKQEFSDLDFTPCYKEARGTKTIEAIKKEVNRKYAIFMLTITRRNPNLVERKPDQKMIEIQEGEGYNNKKIEESKPKKMRVISRDIRINIEGDILKLKGTEKIEFEIEGKEPIQTERKIDKDIRLKRTRFGWKTPLGNYLSTDDCSIQKEQILIKQPEQPEQPEERKEGMSEESEESSDTVIENWH